MRRSFFYVVFGRLVLKVSLVFSIGGRRGGAFGASAPIDDLCLIDMKTMAFAGGQAWGVSDGAIHILCLPAGAADEVMVVVTHPIFEKCRGAGGLDTPDDAFLHQDPEGIIDRLAGNYADLSADILGDRIRCAVGAG